MPNKEKKDLADLRQEYRAGQLIESDLERDPIRQFSQWFDQAVAFGIDEPNAMILSTVTEAGHPDARTVLLKGLEEGRFVFYTNYESAKAKQLHNNHHAHLLFLWLGMARQVRISGRVSRVSEETSRAYFQSRPRESQIGAWASPQSRVIDSRDRLDEMLADITKRFEGEEVLPLPPNWGGFALEPDSIEFWQGRESRLHDRIRYEKSKNTWMCRRLAP